MKKLSILIVAMLALVGCEDTYRYPCQDPENKEKPECNRPMCEADGMCYDKLNGLPEQPPVQETPVEEPAAPAACNCETTGE